jgi:hypothetical protein
MIHILPELTVPTPSLVIVFIAVAIIPGVTIAVGYKAEYNVKHPIPWVDGYASFNDQRTNFFEGNVVNYSKGSITFDDF